MGVSIEDILEHDEAAETLPVRFTAFASEQAEAILRGVPPVGDMVGSLDEVKAKLANAIEDVLLQHGLSRGFRDEPEPYGDSGPSLS